MCSEDNGGFLVTLGDFLHDLPHESPRFWVHTCTRLVKKDDRWVTDQGHRYRKLSLVSSAECASELVSVVLQVEVADRLLDDTTDLVCANTLDQCVELESLLHGHLWEDCVILWTVTNQLSSILELLLNIEALHRDLACGRSNISRQTLESSRFTSTIDTEQGETLSIIETERSLLHSLDRRATERIVFFLEVVHADAVSVVRILLAVRSVAVEQLSLRISHAHRSSAVVTLHGNSALFINDIIVFDQLRTTPVAVSSANAHLGAPVEVEIDL